MNQRKTVNKRKVINPCARCLLPQRLCLCSKIPCLEIETKISLIIHFNELYKNSNTGRLALHALPNSEMRIRGEKGKQLDLSDLLSDNYEPILLFPSEDAEELTSEFMLARKKKIQLIVPDGSWRQARKVNTRHPELNQLPRVKVLNPMEDTYQLRKESRENGMATLQSIAYALGVIEGDHIREQLLNLYQEKVIRSLVGSRKLSWGVLNK